MQWFLLLAFVQFISDPENIVNIYLSLLKINGKHKFKHFLYSVGLKNSLAVTMFTLCLGLSIVVPALMPFACMMFFMQYVFDKFNLLYVYPIDFESKICNGQIQIVYSIIGILLF